MARYGYASVSDASQTHDLQVDALLVQEAAV